MQYSVSQIAKIKTTLFAKLDRELSIANKEGTVEDFLSKYGLFFEEDPMPVNTRTMKILVFGALAGNKSDYQVTAKKLGINPNNIEFQTDYEKLGNYNVSKLEYSLDYSDIIFGSVPHSQTGKGDYSSFLSKIKSDPSKYPRVIEACSNNKLKITISNFKDALFETRYFENIED